MRGDIDEDARAWAQMFRPSAGNTEDVVTWVRETLPRIGWPDIPNSTARQLLWRFWRERWRDDRARAEKRLRTIERDGKQYTAGLGPRSILDILREPEKK